MPPRSLEEILKENPKISRTDLEYIQEWLGKQPHLPQMTDAELVPFLHTQDYSLERTKECLDRYFTIRAHVPELFAFREPASEPVSTQWDLFRLCFLGRDPSGSELVMGWVAEPDASKFDAESGISMVVNGAEVIIRDNPTADKYTLVMDAKNLTMGHIARLPPVLLMKFVKYVQEALPLRFKEIHVLSITPVVEFLLTIVKPFMSKEFINLIHLHRNNNISDFYERVPQKFLPEEYGGNFGSGEEAHRNLQKYIVANTEWLRTLDRRVADESKRPGESKSAGDIFGMEGSFKKLDID